MCRITVAGMNEKEKQIDWQAVEARQLAESSRALERPLLVSDVRTGIRRLRDAGMGRDEVMKLFMPSRPRIGALPPTEVVDLFSEEWPV